MVRSIGISRDRQQKNLLGTLVVGSLAFNAVNSVLFLLLFAGLVAVARKDPPAMVQLESGRAIAMAPLDSQERTPAAIQKFTQDTMTLLLSASGQIPAMSNETTAQPDPGIEIETEDGNLKISTLANLASFGLSEDFRAAFLVELAKRTPQDVFDGNDGTQTILIVQNISEPEPTEEGGWKVTLIANIVTFSSRNQIGTPTPFNKEIFLRPVTPPPVQSYASPLEASIAQVRQGGLEIYGIRNYIRENL